MKTLLLGTILGLFIFLANSPLQAQWGGRKPAGCGAAHCGSCEPACLRCHRECNTEKSKRRAFEVECEYVCIPPVCLPTCNLFGSADKAGWLSGSPSHCQSCGSQDSPSCPTCSGNRGLLDRLCSKLTDCRIRRISRLKRVEYDVEQCVCEWSVVCCRPSGSCSKGGGTCRAPDGQCCPCGE